MLIDRVGVEESSIRWLAEICDGDARIALNSLQLAMESLEQHTDGDTEFKLKFMPLSSIKDGIKVNKLLLVIAHCTNYYFMPHFIHLFP